MPRKYLLYNTGQLTWCQINRFGTNQAEINTNSNTSPESGKTLLSQNAKTSDNNKRKFRLVRRFRRSGDNFGVLKRIDLSANKH